MSLYIVIPWLAFVALVQTCVVPHLTIWGVFPDLPVLAVISWSLLAGARQGITWGFVAGVAVDALSGAPFGAATVGLMAVGFLCGFGEVTLSRASIVLPVVSTFLATIVYDLAFLVVRQLSGDGVAWLDSVVRIVLPSAVLNAILALPALWLMRRVDAFVRERGRPAL